MTNQRQVILRELKKVNVHPTADEIYMMVRRIIPHISLGTVYRNLEILSAMGLVQKLEYSGNQRRYDGNAENHHHIRCVSCGMVADISPDMVTTFEFNPGHVPDWNVLDHRVVFIGVCARCAESKGNVSSSKA